MVKKATAKKKTQEKSMAKKAWLNDDIGEENRLTMWRLQLEVRHVEQRLHDLFFQNLIKGTSHLAIGQEAISAGFGAAMRQDDYTFCTYRGHAHTLVRGASMTGMIGELMGKECGMLKGKGGSMHLTDVEKGAMGSYAIIGAHLPIAAGAAWQAQYNKTGQIAACFFGDGATNIGAFHEALNFAVIWNLPVVYVCENNLYMEYTPISEVTAVEHPAADRACAYGLPSIIVDGNDADAVFRVAMTAFDKARAGGGPSLIEAKTYRYSGHSRADPATYRPDGELDEWMKKDPIPMYRQRLLDFGVKEDVVSSIEEAVLKAVDEATEEAKASPPPPLESAYTDVWADGGVSWRN
ncbi:MAG: thiamine pyrophosphate-dependent dehydrogenase E1 component subunit alpha [Rhodospirillales bacterium]|nr:thiamine pyrophosphate-dependent dehydrogenase E1 component subunit alpha [Rhodospirillales bacterium]MDP7101802.1 thiamine pyrophosphate-dependent dehydrogenase E1 component subunit alpha [Rhodospirillales bacterium]MDP7424231.1 thiamine pyrophosphate-dependent dehydrogenase E1 component subunit alpha [Rhodospirillales bacterium]HJO87694.1 thiamine pyrophosphate-dependent dehydrogenase E1 component subunit alpha [Rhodospirillales bacterium]